MAGRVWQVVKQANVPQLVTADAGYFAQRHECAVERMGVKRDREGAVKKLRKQETR